MDALFSAGFAAEVLRRLPARLAGELEAYSAVHGFNRLLCGFLVTPRPLEELCHALEVALLNVTRYPEEALKVEVEIVHNFSLNNRRSQ